MQNVKLNMIPGSVLPVVNVSQYDEHRQFSLSVYEGATAYDLTGKSVEIRGTKPDGNGFAYDAQDGVVSVSGNTVTISTTQQMTAVGGQTMAELRITSGDTILGTLNFIMDVEPSALSDDTPISETEIPVIERQLEEIIDEIEGFSGDAEAWAVGERDDEPVPSSDPAYHNNSKYYAEDASASATTASTKAGEASTSATNAGSSATTASTAATAAAADSLEAEGWAVGEQNGQPVGPTSQYYQNNAAYYAAQAGQYATGGLIFKGSVAFANIPTTGMVNGDMYNITDDFTTDSRFIEGAGVAVKAGADIAYVAGSVNKWDILALGGGGADALDDLTDVELTSPAEGDLLQRNGNGKWVNSAVIQQKVAGLHKTGCVNRLPITGISEVINGVTWTVVKDANGNVTEITATGASGVNGSNFYTGTTSIGSDIYKLTGCPAGGGNNTYYMHPKVNNSWSNDRYEYGDGILVNGSVENCAITIAPNYTISGTLRFKPMLSDDLSSTYDDYQPYSMTNRELTEAVTGIDGYYATKELDGNGARLRVESLGNGTKTIGTALSECASSLLSLAQSLPSDEYIRPASIYAFVNNSLSFEAMLNGGILKSTTTSINMSFYDTSMITASKVIITTGRMRNTSSDAIQTEITSNGNTFNNISNTVLTSSSNYVRVFYNIYKKI